MDYIKIRFVHNSDGVEAELRRTVEEFMHAAQPRFTLSRQRWRPQIDIYETGDEIVVLAEIAGVPMEDIDLEISPRTVRISGTRESGPREENAHYRLAEIPCGHFERNLTLPVPVDMGRIRAVCRNGIVEVRLVKRPLERVHKISIQGS